LKRNKTTTKSGKGGYSTPTPKAQKGKLKNKPKNEKQSECVYEQLDEFISL
jgi:hypothetical protein